MDLILTVTRYQSHPSQQPLTTRIGPAGGTIGRSPDSDLSLPDPDRWVGRQHARIDFRDGAFLLTDTSKNGTFVNNGATPLREGQQVELQDGDELGIGAYQVQVSVETSRAQPAAPFDPFAVGEPDLGPLAQPASGQAAPDILDLVGAAPAGAGPASPPSAPPQAPSEPDDWLTPPAADKEPWTPGTERAAPPAPAAPTEADHTPEENVFFSPPEAIPENYDIWADESHPLPGGSTAANGEDEPPDLPPAQDSSPSEAQEVAAQPPPPPPVVPRPAQPSPPPARSDAPQVLQSFLTGLGSGELPADPQDQARLLQTAGLLLRTMTEGLMRVLMGRTSFKSELRLEMTAIRSTRNNPFKFSVDPEDALAHLLFRASRGYLPPVEAAREAFDDIQCHEMAIIAGMRAALGQLLARMDPAELEKRFEDRSVIDNLMPMARKAKYWDLFTATYEEISADTADDFLHLFKDAFARAYDEQSSRLRQVRPQDQVPPDEQQPTTSNPS